MEEIVLGKPQLFSELYFHKFSGFWFFKAEIWTFLPKIGSLAAVSRQYNLLFHDMSLYLFKKDLPFNYIWLVKISEGF